MDIITSSVKWSYCLTLDHPFFALLGGVIGFWLLVKFYLRVTLGICDCQVNMKGKTVIITGANAGIGKHTAEVLAERGARLILACRNEKKALKVRDEIIAKTGNRQVVFKHLDLASFPSVRAFAKDILANENRLDVLINNAGIIGSPDGEVTADGQNMIMQSNHLSHFLLTNLLLELLKKSAPSRIINVSSDAYARGKMNLNDLSLSGKTSWFAKYSCSKMANILFTLGLAKRLKGTGVTANALHPGAVRTDILRTTSGFVVFILRFFVGTFAKTALEGAQTTIHLAQALGLAKVTGKYFSDCREKALTSWAREEANAEKLWKTSEKIVGL